MQEQDIFSAALGISDPGARRAFLDAQSADDSALRERIEAQLQVAFQDAEALPERALQTDQLCMPSQTHDSPSSHEQATAETLQLGPGSAPPSELRTEWLTPGSVFGRYQVESLLGRGGMGVVYLVRDLRLGRRVALKIPRFDVHQRLAAIERFHREARIMASIQHRNLCPVYDVDEVDGVHFLTMAFIEGPTLSERVQNGPPLTQRQAAELIHRVALALDKAHRSGVVHRDLKPANIIIDLEDEPVLMDFGLARSLQDAEARLTQTGFVIGTPAYMAPEQVEGESDKVRPAADIYSLGAILYELLTGRTIHTGSVTQVLAKLMSQSALPLRQFRAEVEPELERICMKAVSRHPDERYPTARAFADALGQYLGVSLPPASQAEIPTLSPSAPESMPEESHRPRWATIAGVLLLLGGIWLYGLSSKTRENDSSPKNTAGTNAVSPEVGPNSSTNPPDIDSVPSNAATVAPTIEDPPLWPDLSLHPLLSSQDEWSPPQPLKSAVNSEAFESGPFLSADGLTLYFHSNRVGDRGAQLWQAKRRSVDVSFRTATMLDDIINGEGHNFDPTLTADQLTMVWSSNRPHAGGGVDLWMSTRPNVQDAWSSPENLGPEVNSKEWEFEPELSADGLSLYFHTFRADKTGGSEICVSRRRSRDEPFGTPEFLGPPVNTAHDEGGACLVADGRLLLFHRRRDQESPFTMWMARRASVQDDFGEVLGPLGTEFALEMSPTVSAAGRTLFFASARSGSFDIWAIQRVKRADVTNATTPLPVRQHPLVSDEWEWSPPVNLGAGVNTTAAEDHAAISKDGLTLVFVRGESAGRSLWHSTRTSTQEQFGTAVKLPGGIQSNVNDSCPCLSPDGLTLWFTSDRTGGMGNDDLWISRRQSASESFGVPMNLGPSVNTADQETSPFVTADGLELLFTRGLPHLIYRATRNAVDEPFGNVAALKSTLNDSTWSEFPRLTADGRIMALVTTRDGGEQSLWLSTRESTADEFANPINLGPEINNALVSGPSLSGDEKTLYFSSRRPGGQRGLDIWSVTRVKKDPSLVP